MIDAVSLQTFKCFQDIRIPLGTLTLLTGFNAGGKSTIIQSLLLLQQAASMEAGARRLLLSGPIVQMGTLRDVVDKVNGSGRFSIGIESGPASVRWTLEGTVEDREHLSVPVSAVEWRGDGDTSLQSQRGPATPFLPVALRFAPEDTSALALALNALRAVLHVPADRIGPQETFPLEDLVAHRTLGPRAERSIGTLHWHGTDPIDVDLYHPGESRRTLLQQTVAWLGDLFPGVNLEVQRVPSANLVSLRIRTGPDSDSHRPQHVGFGITHVLPIIVAALSSSKGDLLIFENPEAHLHPNAQAKLARFLCRVAAAGRQVVIETHSDHILNGARIAIKDGIISPIVTVLHFFRARGAPTESQVTTLQIALDGAIEQWPSGFFDQIERDTLGLLGV